MVTGYREAFFCFLFCCIFMAPNMTPWEKKRMESIPLFKPLRPTLNLCQLKTLQIIKQLLEPVQLCSQEMLAST